MAGPPALPGPLADGPPSASAGAVTEVPEVTRAQKPEGVGVARRATPGRLLDLPLDRPPEAQQANPAATILALVNGEPILLEEVKASSAQMLMQARSPREYHQVLKEVLEQLIDREVVLQDAFGKLEQGGPQGKKFLEKLKELAGKEFDKRWLKQMMKANHIASEEEFTEFLRAHQIELPLIRRQWERNFMAHEYLLSRIEPHVNRIGRLDIADYYARHREEFTRPDSVQWQDIYVEARRHASHDAARAFAEALAERVRKGEDFARLSHDYDNGDSVLRKGEGQGHKHGEIQPREAEPILFAMHDGDVTVIERPRGFHVVRLVKREEAGPIPFDDKVQKEIRDKLRNEVFQREMKRIVTDLRHKAVIEEASAPN
jgi:parvulin-like peptidyl-prolyl isomerase